MVGVEVVEAGVVVEGGVVVDVVGVVVGVGVVEAGVEIEVEIVVEIVEVGVGGVVEGVVQLTGQKCNRCSTLSPNSIGCADAGTPDSEGDGGQDT